MPKPPLGKIQGFKMKMMAEEESGLKKEKGKLALFVRGEEVEAIYRVLIWRLRFGLLIIKVTVMKIESMRMDFHGILTLVFSPTKTENAVDK